MRVLGTAGHVDHGKSTLVQALTGMDPDRLQEEKDRQMTIDLGFAWMTLPSGDGLGIIDVPGHRDFIENMLAGVGGIDAAMLVIAADEGLMPQTIEHLAILDLLEIGALIVALTRIDLVHELDWIDLVEEEIRALLNDTRYPVAPIVRVSGVTGEGLESLTEIMDQTMAETRPPSDRGRPRLPIDRAFSITGFGTVVTGTLVDGSLRIGQEVQVLPQDRNGRLRGLQTHKQTVDIAAPGSRVAANLTGVSVEQLNRGDVLVSPGTDSPTSMVDVSFRCVADATFPIRHNATAKLFTGSAQRMARIRLLGESEITPGESGWLQLVLEAPVVVRRGDHFILRRPSPGATLGGGRVAEPHPVRKHRRNDPSVINSLRTKLGGARQAVLYEALDKNRPTLFAKAVAAADLEPEAAHRELKDLEAQEKLIILNPEDPREDHMVISIQAWEYQTRRASELLAEYHKRYPNRAGMPVEEFRSRMGSSAQLLTAEFVRQGRVAQTQTRVALPEFEVRLSSKEQAQIDALLKRFDIEPYSPPSLKQSRQAVGEDLLDGLIESGRLIKVSEDVLFSEQAYADMRAKVSALIRDQSEITVAEVRDLFGTTRRYALALMEHFDAIGLTYRDGDVRRLLRTLSD